jgi:hypothetical protein
MSTGQISWRTGKHQADRTGVEMARPVYLVQPTPQSAAGFVKGLIA